MTGCRHANARRRFGGHGGVGGGLTTASWWCWPPLLVPMGNDDTLMEGEGQHARPPARPPARLTMPCCLALPCQLALRLAGGARGGGGGIGGGAAAPCLGETLKAILNGCPPAPMPPFVRSMEGLAGWPAGWAGGREKQDNLATVDACGIYQANGKRGRSTANTRCSRQPAFRGVMMNEVHVNNL